MLFFDLGFLLFSVSFDFCFVLEQRIGFVLLGSLGRVGGGGEESWLRLGECRARGLRGQGCEEGPLRGSWGWEEGGRNRWVLAWSFFPDWFSLFHV